jgi:surface protein
MKTMNFRSNPNFIDESDDLFISGSVRIMSYIKQRHHDSRELNHRRNDIPQWVVTGEMEHIQLADDPDRAAGVGTAVCEKMEPEGMKQSPSKDPSLILTQPPEVPPQSHHCVDTDEDPPEPDSLQRKHLVKSQREPENSFIEESFVVTFAKDPILTNHNPKSEEVQSNTSSTTDTSPLVVAAKTTFISDSSGAAVASKSSSIAVLEKPSISIPEVVRNVTFSEKDPIIIGDNRKRTSKWNLLGTSRSTFMFSGLAIGVAIIIVVVGTVCGTGKCQASNSSSAAASPASDNVTRSDPTSSPVVQVPPSLRPATTTAPSFATVRPAMTMAPLPMVASPQIPSPVQELNVKCSLEDPISFTSTPELYKAVDAYIKLSEMLGSGFNENVTENYNVTLCYGYPMNAWDVSRIMNFSRLFDPYRDLPYERNRNIVIYNKTSTFHEDLNNWDTSSAVTMFGMFAYANAFNGNISSWNLSSVTNTSDMFYRANLFRGGNDVLQWDVSRVQSMAYMFAYAVNFIGNISLWNTSSVIELQSTFEGAQFFQTDLSQWDTSKVVNMAGTFKLAYSFQSNLSGWDVSNVENMDEMFQAARVFNGSLSQWDVSRVNSMAFMFYGATVYNDDLSLWDVGNVVNMRSMFALSRNFASDLSEWDVSNVVIMTRMFGEAMSFEGDLSAWNVSKVRSMDYMFFNATQFNSNLSQWDVRTVENFQFMFQNADVFNQDISAWNISNVQTMNSMFYNATSFNQNLCPWGTLVQSANVNVTNMFAGSGCKKASDPVLSEKPSNSSSWCQVCNK